MKEYKLMRKIRKFSVMMVILLVFCTFSYCPVSAASQSKSNCKLICIEGIYVNVDKNLSVSEISLLTPDVLSDVNLNDGPILSVTQTTTTEDFDNALNSNTVMPMSVIPTSQLKLTVVAQRTNTDPTWDYIKFTAVATWNVLPVVLLTDSFGIAWSDDFTLYDDVCYVRYRQFDMGQIVYNTIAVARSHCAAEAGVGYQFHMHANFGNSEPWQCDRAVIYAWTKKLNSSGSMNVVAEYAHEFLSPLGLTVGMSFSKSPSVSFSIPFGVGVNTASPAYDDFTY
jgi:hypothetical protein